MIKILALIIFSVAIVSCTHKGFTPFTVIPATCDTSAVAYFKDVQPVLRANCYSCHGSAVTQQGGLDLENFTSLKAYLQQGFRGDGVYGSKLYHCMLHTTYALPMPPTYKVDSCSMNKIKAWMDQGGLYN